MAVSQMSDVVRHLRRVVLLLDGAGLTDGQLLECFLGRGEDAALSALVRRHSPLVWGVCRRILGNHHDAEDAFQATFLVLVRKARAIMPREKVANWLYGVATQTARKARATAARRKGRERQVTPMPDIEARQEELWNCIEPRLDVELSRLPEKYRAVLILCDLEGRTRKEAARQLGVPEGTVAGHLARARDMLAKRLTRNGSAMSGAALAALLTQQTASAAVPAALAIKTAKAVTLMAAGKAAAGLIPAQVLSLAQGVMQAMLLKKLKIGIVVLLMVLGTAGVGGLGVRGLASGDQEVPVKQRQLENAVEFIAPAQAKADNQPAPTPLGAGPPRLQVEHKSIVMCLAWSPDGKRVATGTKEGAVRITDVATGVEVQNLSLGNSTVGIAFSPDGKTLAVIEDGPGIGIWDIGTGKEQRKMGGVGALNMPEFVACTADGDCIIGVGVGAFYYWSAKGGKGVTTGLGNQGFAALAPDGLVGGWSTPSGSCKLFYYVSTMPRKAGPIDPTKKPGPSFLTIGACQSIAFGPGGKLLAVGADDNQVHLWDIAEKKATVNLTGLEKPATKLTFSADGKTLAALSGDAASIHVYDLTRNATRCLINHNCGEVASMALSPDGKMLATAAKDGKVLYVWNTSARLLGLTGPSLDLSAKDLASLWTELTNADFEKADAAWRKLGQAGDNAIPFLRAQIRASAVPAADMNRIEKLVAELNAEKFTTREQATKELTTAGELAIVPLRRILEKPPSEEARERASLVLKKLGEPVLTPERQRVLDAIDLLEQLRTDMATELLREIDRDALIPQIRLAARQALQRMKQ
jgi:RNA polymerase sigma factor (sigma-70 family)